jgi:hypothetical protein
VSYRFARRSFLAGIGGAVGLRIMLRNIEASAAGAPPPPRFLLAYWPGGTIKYYFNNDRILKPFVDASLAGDMSTLFGLNSSVIPGFGSGEERGTVAMTTGARIPGTRQNGGEADDAVAGGPSFDQIFLKNVPGLQRPGVGSVSALCDARVDSFETSAMCLSYDYATRDIPAAQGGSNGAVTEHIPRLPTLKPTALYAQLFSGFAPGDPGGGDRMTNLLRARKSVLDHSQRELARLRTLVPADSRVKIDAHADAIRKVEVQLAAQIATRVPGGSCAPPPAPGLSLEAKTGSRNDYKPLGVLPVSTTDDTMSLEQIGRAFLAVIRAAFQCDIIRVAAFQWAPATNHVAFKGLHPADLTANVMYHPSAHQITDTANVAVAPPASGFVRDTIEFLANVMTWFNQKLADALVDFKTATDVFGGNLLRQTVIPYVTDIAYPTDVLNPKPALIFGGGALGMRGGQSLTFSPSRHQNDLWATIAQAYLGEDALAALAGEKFMKTGVAPIADLWGPVA